MSSTNLQRRRVRAGVLATAAVLVLGAAAPATAGDGHGHGGRDTYQLTVMGTTDLHGSALNWDYFTNAEYDDSAHNDVGLAKISTLVNQVRADRGDRNTLLLDAGDTIQGTSLAYYYAKIQPISKRVEHPMATAMNAIGYDAAALGNHEFNYGIPYLRTFEKQLDFPLLAANATLDKNGRAAFTPYVIKTVRTPHGKPVKVGILGLTNPGIAIWDKANVEGQMSFGGLVEQAARYVPEMRRKGADVVVVSAHSGADTSSSYGDALPFPENAATLVAEQVPGIDAILVGHAHQEIAERVVTNTSTGRPVVLSEPLKWGQRLSVFDIDLSYGRGRWTVQSVDASVLNSNTVPEDPKIVRLLADEQQTVVDYVNGVIGTSTEAMSAATARYEDAAVLDFINHVQAGAVKAELTGADADLPVLSIAAPFNKDAAIPQGDVSVRDIAGLYIYDNTLLGIRLTGAQVKAYLEKSAEYFKPALTPGTYPAASLTNAVTPTAPNGTPDYNYDVMGGLDAPLTYDIDLAQPVGSRVVGLAYDGVPVTDAQEFVVAINNYRQSGGGNFPGVTTAPVVYNRQVEIRQLLIDWVSANQVVDPAVFSSTNPDWRLTSGGTPLTVTP
ncbi:bifunctional metallophosphatase/5'-nucleotidase [Cellulomonas terrae]|uniref:Multifunctional 2',3'-cyclic-nucleotide 2'-phosphodiesterase/5'-nucleotidase/3'-nucleotidase n=1 Tax=Cellulomonas terrae TaxID=311234 RepID=A0A511JHB6_9CELL|nr:5'-nucleotidase C-terminal domain-containing protein [Cellulomonas terrae]GEL97083.1 multifunctional 2',3'-cyclic-nucleotide 2'-phosphodiesterase/5'-nucleotidase/3'-nucleotidase [Cellulomonas terrae]